MNKGKVLNDWILELLKKYNYNTSEVYECYNQGVKEGVITSKRSTYERVVRRLINSGDNKKVKDIPENIDNIRLKDEINYLKGQITKIRTDNNKLHEESFVNSRLLNTFKEELVNLKPDNFAFNVNINIIHRLNNRLNNILFFGDLHYGEVVNPEHINYINDYNTSVAKERIIKLFQENLKTVKYAGADTLYMMMLGDIFSGTIHDELNETNEKGITNLILDLFKFFTGILLEYKSQFDKIIISCVCGNHGRLTQDFRFKNKQQNNFEYLFYKFLEEKFINDDKIKINVSESPVMIVEVENLKVKIEHGENYKGGNGFNLMPYNTVSRDNLKDFFMFKQIKKEYDILALGHFHVAGITYPNSNQIMIFNPSIIGANEYSINKMHSAFNASQYSLITDEKEIKYSRLINLQ